LIDIRPPSQRPGGGMFVFRNGPDDDG